MLGAVAKRYAMALFQIALERQRVEQVDDQAKLLKQLFRDPVVAGFIRNPKVPVTAKKQVVTRRLKELIDPAVLNLVLLLIDKRRAAFLPDIMEYYDVLTDRYVGVEEVTVVSAVPLRDEQLDLLLKQVQRFSAYGKLRLSQEVNSGVLGGVKVKLGDNLVVDGTLSSRLHAMRDRLYKYRHRGVGV